MINVILSVTIIILLSASTYLLGKLAGFKKGLQFGEITGKLAGCAKATNQIGQTLLDYGDCIDAKEYGQHLLSLVESVNKKSDLSIDPDGLSNFEVDKNGNLHER